jgi:hypothetical protein
MTAPTDADRATGQRITQTVHGGLMADAIAQALADERARAVAEIRRAAGHYATSPHTETTWGTVAHTLGLLADRVADR